MSLHFPIPSISFIYSILSLMRTYVFILINLPRIISAFHDPPSPAIHLDNAEHLCIPERWLRQVPACSASLPDSWTRRYQSAEAFPHRTFLWIPLSSAAGQFSPVPLESQRQVWNGVICKTPNVFWTRGKLSVTYNLTHKSDNTMDYFCTKWTHKIPD